jgi:hypothetical protein
MNLKFISGQEDLEMNLKFISGQEDLEVKIISYDTISFVPNSKNVYFLGLLVFELE